MRRALSTRMGMSPSVEMDTADKANYTVAYEKKEVMRCLLCGGKDCSKCGLDAYKKLQNPAIELLHSHWITDDIIGMQRPNETSLLNGALDDMVKKKVTAIFNLTEPGEHPFCGCGVSNTSGFPYHPETLMSRGIKHFNFNWQDMTVPSLAMMDQIVFIACNEIRNGGKIAVHCHAGFGRTGLTIACILIAKEMLSAESVVTFVRNRRPGSVQTSAQQQFVAKFEKHRQHMIQIFPTYEDVETDSRNGHKPVVGYSQTISDSVENQRQLLNQVDQANLEYKYLTKVVYLTSKSISRLSFDQFNVACLAITGLNKLTVKRNHLEQNGFGYSHIDANAARAESLSTKPQMLRKRSSFMVATNSLSESSEETMLVEVKLELNQGNYSRFLSLSDVISADFRARGDSLSKIAERVESRLGRLDSHSTSHRTSRRGLMSSTNSQRLAISREPSSRLLQRESSSRHNHHSNSHHASSSSSGSGQTSASHLAHQSSLRDDMSNSHHRARTPGEGVGSNGGSNHAGSRGPGSFLLTGPLSPLPERMTSTLSDGDEATRSAESSAIIAALAAQSVLSQSNSKENSSAAGVADDEDNLERVLTRKASLHTQSSTILEPASPMHPAVAAAQQMQVSSSVPNSPMQTLGKTYSTTPLPTVAGTSVKSPPSIEPINTANLHKAPSRKLLSRANSTASQADGFPLSSARSTTSQQDHSQYSSNGANTPSHKGSSGGSGHSGPTAFATMRANSLRMNTENDYAKSKKMAANLLAQLLLDWLETRADSVFSVETITVLQDIWEKYGGIPKVTDEPLDEMTTTSVDKLPNRAHAAHQQHHDQRQNGHGSSASPNATAVIVAPTTADGGTGQSNLDYYSDELINAVYMHLADHLNRCKLELLSALVEMYRFIRQAGLEHTWHQQEASSHQQQQHHNGSAVMTGRSVADESQLSSIATSPVSARAASQTAAGATISPSSGSHNFSNNHHPQSPSQVHDAGAASEAQALDALVGLRLSIALMQARKRCSGLVRRRGLVIDLVKVFLLKSSASEYVVINNITFSADNYTQIQHNLGLSMLAQIDIVFRTLNLLVDTHWSTNWRRPRTFSGTATGVPLPSQQQMMHNPASPSTTYQQHNTVGWRGTSHMED